MLKETSKFDFSTLLEGMTSLRALLSASEEGINDRRILEVLYDTSKEKKIYKELGYLRAISTERGFTVTGVPTEQIESLAIGTSHGGILARCTDRTLPCLTDASVLSTVREGGFYTMIEGIEDPYNFGYAIRSLYACGCDGIIVPNRNWFSAAGVVARSSAGASERIAVYRTDTSMAAVDAFHSLGFSVLCADEKSDCILGHTTLPLPLLLVVGGEKRGITAAVLQAADIRVKIAYARPFRASLSAASATTMFAYEIARQHIRI